MNAPALREFSYRMIRYRRTWRGTVVVSVANPLMFLLALGGGLGTLIDRNAPASLGDVSYVAFLAPGLLAAATMQTAVLESTGPVYESTRGRGNYRAASATCVEPFQIYLGHLLFIAFRAVTSALAFVAVMAAFGLSRSPGTAAALVGAAALTGVAFAAPMAAWAVGVRRPASLDSVFRFVVMPLYMLSGTFFAVDQLPAAVRPLAWVTPLWHGVDLCRTVSLGTDRPAMTIVHVCCLVALTVAGCAAGRVTYRRQLHP
ncbi:ABC transporter permease [Streptomyces sp. WMMC500]|uniref:ABC transporter permease n=1 Tax=Streptomyces sp. WMMC500 TaxID=3015154 RepID=UPI00248BEBF0|nr:ABC transporter permease [Streptomyces sp. WMMC500]WBB60782.1 ABC transporter permease [Streptomyces sp. WMMC500]